MTSVSNLLLLFVLTLLFLSVTYAYHQSFSGIIFQTKPLNLHVTFIEMRFAHKDFHCQQ